MKDMIFKHYSRILDDLIDEYNFFRYYFQRPYSIGDDILGEYEAETFQAWCLDIRFGISRGCLIDNSYDYVVKFDFPDEIENACCDDEVYIYNQAKCEGFEKYLAEPIFLGVYTKTINTYSAYDINTSMDDFYGFDEEDFSNKLQSAKNDFGFEREEITIELPLYAYPRAEYYNFPRVSDEDSARLAKSNCEESPLLERSMAVAATFMRQYGEEVFDAFSEFLQTMKINDLHAGNVMKHNGHLILTDYCGYHDKYDY